MLCGTGARQDVLKFYGAKVYGDGPEALGQRSRGRALIWRRRASSASAAATRTRWSIPNHCALSLLPFACLLAMEKAEGLAVASWLVSCGHRPPHGFGGVNLISRV